MIVTTWWEHKNIINYLDEFRRVGFFFLFWGFGLSLIFFSFSQELFVPLVRRLGYSYPENEDVSIKELRTKAIVQAAEAGDIEFVTPSYSFQSR